MGTLARLEVKTLKLDQIRFGQVMATLLLPFYRGQIFEKNLCTSLGGFGRADVFGRLWRQIYNVFGAGCTSCHVLPCAALQDVLAASPADTAAVVHLPEQDFMRALPHGECDQSE